MKNFFTKTMLTASLALVGGLFSTLHAQVLEWRLTNVTYSAADPDAGGPANGSVTFTAQIHTVSGTVSNINSISTGYSYQSTKAMVPTTPGCAIVSNPANITVSAFLQAGGFTYTSVNQCGSFTPATPVGGQIYDRRAVGTLDGTGVTITTTWQDMFTVTLWTLGTTYPQGGYAIINSGEGGTPGEFTTYAVSDAGANGYITNSLTYLVGLPLGGSLVPVTFTKFDAKCNGNGTVITWETAQELNSRQFEIQKSQNGSSWETVATVAAAGNSANTRRYSQLDLAGGTALYRIKQTDKDGQFIYTNIERTNCEAKTISSVIYPVPAQDVLNVVIKSDRMVKTQLMVFEASGKLVRKVDVSIVNGNNTFKINTTGLASGEYLIRSSNAEVNFSKQFSIVN